MRVAVIALGLAVLVVAAWFVLRGTDPSTPDGVVPGTDAGTKPATDGPALAGRGEPEPRVEGPPVDARLEAPPVLATGIVVDDTRRPVADAEIFATVSGRETGRIRSAPDGRFEVPLVPHGEEVLFGRLVIRKGARGAIRQAYIGPDLGDRLDYGRITLTDLHALTVRVLRAGAAVAGAEVVVADDTGARAGTLLPSARSDAEGLARFDGVHGEKVVIHGVASGTGRAYREIRLPAEGVVDLELPEDRMATIHVKHGVTGAPVAGAEVSLTGGGTMPPPSGTGCLPPLPDVRTNAEGTVVVSGLPGGHLWVVARAPGLAMRNEGMMLERVILQPEATEATVTLRPYRTVRFPISEGAVGAPPEGTTLRVRRYQPLPGYDVGQPRARIEGGELVLEPFPPGFDWGHVVSDDGRWALWRAPHDKDVGEPVAFRKVVDLHVRLTWPDGEPAVGERLSLRTQPRGRHEPESTDEDGEVVFEDVIGESAMVMWSSRATGFGAPLRNVSLLVDPGPLTVTVERPVEIALRLRRDGVPSIPMGLDVRAPGPDPSGRGAARSVLQELREDPEKGEISFRWIAMPGGTAPPVSVRADGIPETTVTPQRAEDGVWRADVDLRVGSALRVRVTAPEDGRYWLQMEQWDEAGRSWGSLLNHPAYESGRRAVDGVHAFPGLPPGRYRLVEGYTGLTSDPVEVGGGGDVEVRFDVSAMVIVRGRVEVPEGENPAYASLRVKDRRYGQASVANPVRVRPDGSFEFRAVRGERLVLVAEHPLLRPAVDSETVRVGTDPASIRFVTGPHVVFRLEGSELTTAEPDPSVYPPWSSPVHLRVREPGAWDSEGPTSVTIAKGGVFRAGVPGPGRWTLRVEQPGFVPIVLEEVEVGPGATDLGTLRPFPGATLTLRILPAAGGLPQGLSVQAELQGDRPYAVWGSAVVPGDPPTVTVKGLGAGRFTLVVRPEYQGPPIGEATVESDGTSPITAEVKLR